MLRTPIALLNSALNAPLALVTIALAMIAAVAIGDWLDPAPPKSWRLQAQPRDILFIEDREVVYWGRPDATYSRYATRSKMRPAAIVVHFNLPRTTTSLIRYGHSSDPTRGNASYGYHFYIDRDGKILQGAPLSRRTNHVKFRTNPKRRPAARYVWSGNSIGISLVGACDPLKAPLAGHRLQCARETPTKAQLAAGMVLIRALQKRFHMTCKAVFGHGELQFDRQSFEGLTLSKMARTACDTPAPTPETKRREEARAPAPPKASGG